MTDKTKSSYKLLDNYCLRTPLLPNSLYKNLTKTSTLSNLNFKAILKDTILREAIYIASPELYAQIVKWEQGELKDISKIKKLHYAVLKYLTRICTRSTPFGLFASCSVGSFSGDTSITLNTKSQYKRFTRFDTTFLTQLLQELLKYDAIKKHLLFYPNTSLYKISDHYRYVEYCIENKLRVYTLEGINASEYIAVILKHAKAGKTINTLVKVLVDDEITESDAKSFINDLINNQILVSELEITVTGNDYFENLLKRINQIPEALEVYNQITKLNSELKKLDVKIGNSPKVYKNCNEIAKKLVPNLYTKYLFQTDCFTNTTTNTLDANIKLQLQKAFLVFNKMTLPYANGKLEQFKTSFLKRFEDSEVPLSLALDTETGVGFGIKKDDNHPMLDDLPLQGEPKKRYERIVWTDVDTILQKKLITATKGNQYTITVTDADFKDLPVNLDDLPDTFSSLIEVYASKIFISGTGGSSAVNLLGRFSYGNKALYKHVKSITDIEAKINKTKILAEIVHLPQSRTGNILQRPHIRAYEIPYLGNSNLEKECQILIDDIMVSIKNNHIKLQSRCLNKEILPRLGNAHNYSANSLPIYQFLCELQSQKKRSNIGFSWNEILEKHPFLPRVEYQNLIFSKARWLIETKIFKSLFENENLLLKAEKWQEELLLPNYVELVEGDNRLLIHLKNETSLKMLSNTINRKKRFVLEEFLFSDDAVVKDREGQSYCNQVIVSFYNHKKLQDFESNK